MITVDGILAEWSRERPDLDVSPMAVVGRLSRVNALFEAGMSEDYAQWRLDGGSFDVLFTLVRSGAPYALSPSTLAASSMVSTAAVAQRLNRLVAAGLVTRAPDPNDGRGTVVTLTSAGKQLANRALPSHLQAEERLLASLSATDRADLAALLELVLTAKAAPV